MRAGHWRGDLVWVKRLARLRGRFVSKRGMRPDVVVIIAPERELETGIVQRIEQRFIEAFVS